MHTIYKYPIDVVGVITLRVPVGATFLHVESVNDVVTLWARINDAQPLVDRRLAMFTTGDELTREALIRGTFVGTAVTMNGRLVWHVYDLGEEVVQ